MFLPFPVFLKPSRPQQPHLPQQPPKHKYIITSYGHIPAYLIILFFIEIPLIIGGIFCILYMDKEIALVMPLLLCSLPGLIWSIFTIYFIANEIVYIKKYNRRKVLV